ncbi:MAG: TrkH family potassium uptake protein [Pseudomonadota bacterium]
MTSNFRPTLLIVGLLLATFGNTMMIPALVDLLSGHSDWRMFAVSGLVTTLTGTALYLSARELPLQLTGRQAFVMTVCAWVALSFFGALPFYWTETTPTFTDAFFESISGITTTGSTVLTGLDSMPTGILLWRGMLQWMGGLGIVVMAVAVLPMLQIGGMQLFKAEAFDTADKILPRATQISGSLTAVFAIGTLICALLYLSAGMDLLDAVVHAMTTVATGGFSTHDASIGHYDGLPVQLISTLFMILGSIPFILYIQLLRGRPLDFWNDSQVRTFLVLLACFILIAWMLELRASPEISGTGFVQALFNVTSIMTGTGYATDAYDRWGSAAIAFFFFIMFFGGCAGSTSCGIKIFRFQVMFLDIAQHLNRIISPNAVVIKRFNGKPLSNDVSTSVMSFFFLYLLTFAVSSIAMSLTGLDTLTALSGAGSALANVGPGLGELIGPAGTYQSLPDTAKWILSVTMLIGRLELFTVLILLLPGFWRS